jgi:hypothetical protein
VAEAQAAVGVADPNVSPDRLALGGQQLQPPSAVWVQPTIVTGP